MIIIDAVHMAFSGTCRAEPPISERAKGSRRWLAGTTAFASLAISWTNGLFRFYRCWDQPAQEYGPEHDHDDVVHRASSVCVAPTAKKRAAETQPHA
jgi:hypothetical protein